MGKPLDSPASFWPISLTSCVSKLFERIILSRLLFFLKPNFILTPHQAGFRPGRSTIDQILYLSQSISDGFNKPRPGSWTIFATIDFSKAFDSVWHPNLFHELISAGLPPCFALLVGLNLSFLIGALAWSIKITKAVLFESVEVFRKDPLLTLFFPLYSLMIFLLLCFLPSAALFMRTIWPFGPLQFRSPLPWRLHKELCFDWSAGLSTGVFLSIRANVRPPFCQWNPTKLTSSPTSSYSALASFLIPLQLFLESPLTALFPFLSMYLRWRPSFSHILRPNAVSLLPHGAPLRSPSLLCLNLFFSPFSRFASLGWFCFLRVTNNTKLERLHRAASRGITGCLSSSPLPLLLSEASLPPLRVTLTHFTLLS